ncbi:hypothetical protein HQ576_02365 [bacterium]|nr:hypothetical protein [bacterium]
MDNGDLTVAVEGVDRHPATLTVEEMYGLLGVDRLDGDASSLQRLAAMTQKIVDIHSMQWLKDHRRQILAEWRRLLA